MRCIGFGRSLDQSLILQDAASDTPLLDHWRAEVGDVTTSHTYQHVTKGMQAGAAQEVADLILGTRTTQPFGPENETKPQ